MIKTAKDQPSVVFATCARLIGPEVKLTIEQSLPGNLFIEDWQIMREVIAAVRQALPDVKPPPGAVLEGQRPRLTTLGLSSPMDIPNRPTFERNTVISRLSSETLMCDG